MAKKIIKEKLEAAWLRHAQNYTSRIVRSFPVRLEYSVPEKAPDISNLYLKMGVLRDCNNETLDEYEQLKNE